MRERPILFSATMVRAILDGRKTQTRRVVKPQPEFETGYDYPHENEIGVIWKKHEGLGFDDFLKLCPYGKPGDRLWVRETFMGCYDWTSGKPIFTHVAAFKADWYELEEGEVWQPSIHMPRWASRITLEIKNVRVERLNDISEEDAKAEGVEKLQNYCDDQWLSCGKVRFGDQPNKFKFGVLWDSINSEKYPWNQNPWVWVIEFERKE